MERFYPEKSPRKVVPVEEHAHKRREGTRYTENGKEVETSDEVLQRVRGMLRVTLMV